MTSATETRLITALQAAAAALDLAATELWRQSHRANSDVNAAHHLQAASVAAGEAAESARAATERPKPMTEAMVCSHCGSSRLELCGTALGSYWHCLTCLRNMEKP